jgi:hypothetical protein
MNLLPLAALIIAALAFATSVTAIVLVQRLRPRQRQVAGDGSTQVQSGGSITIDETDLGRIERQAREAMKMGRQL